MQEKQEKKKGLTPKLKRLMVILLSTGGTILALYIGGYLMLIAPVIELFHKWHAATLTHMDLLRIVISVLLSSTIGGAIWCIFDVIASFFREREDDNF